MKTLKTKFLVATLLLLSAFTYAQCGTPPPPIPEEVIIQQEVDLSDDFFSITNIFNNIIDVIFS